MTQRRTPSGQAPARRPGQPGRGAGRASGRPTARVAGVRGEGPTAGSGRSASRPAAARRAAAGGAAKRTSAPQPSRFTGRATILVVVLVALALGYTYPVRVYLSQQSDIARMEAAQQDQRKRIGELSEQAAKWQDDEYVRIQARKRFYMVYPGEVPLLVLFDPAGAARDAGIDPNAGKTKKADPWYDTLWSSVKAADQQDRQ